MVNQNLFSLKRSNYISGIIITVTVLFVLSPSVGFIPASAHTSVNVDNIEIDVGWGIEPPVVGIRNDFVFKISEIGDKEGLYTGITNAFKDLESTAMYGGATKKLDINSDSRPGHYFSPVIPTKTGSIMMDFKGTINGIIIDVQIPIEDVESTAILDFPPRNTLETNSEISSMKNAISFIQKEVLEFKSGSENIGENKISYDLAVFGIFIGSAGIILAIIAMIKSKSDFRNQIKPSIWKN